MLCSDSWLWRGLSSWQDEKLLLRNEPHLIVSFHSIKCHNDDSVGGQAAFHAQIPTWFGIQSDVSVHESMVTSLLTCIYNRIYTSQCAIIRLAYTWKQTYLGECFVQILKDRFPAKTLLYQFTHQRSREDLSIESLESVWFSYQYISIISEVRLRQVVFSNESVYGMTI